VLSASGPAAAPCWAIVRDGVDVATVKGHVSHNEEPSTGHQHTDRRDARGGWPADRPSRKVSDTATSFLEPTAAQPFHDQVLDVQKVVSNDGYQYYFTTLPSLRRKLAEPIQRPDGGHGESNIPRSSLNALTSGEPQTAPVVAADHSGGV